MDKTELDRLGEKARALYWQEKITDWVSLHISVKEQWRRVVETLWKEWDSTHTSVDEIRKMLPRGTSFRVYSDGSGFVAMNGGRKLAKWSYFGAMETALKSLTPPEPTREEDLETLAKHATILIIEGTARNVEAIAAARRMKARDAK